MAWELYLLVPLVAGLGAVVRGVTGFGPALVLVALASAFLPLRTVIVLAALLDVVGGLVLWVATRHGRAREGWRLGALLFVGGAVIGGLGFELVSTLSLTRAAALVLAFAGIGTVLRQVRGSGAPAARVAPPRPAVDHTWAFLSGVIGGLVAVGGYFLAAHLVNFVTREVFRNTMCRILLLGALARAGTYAGEGWVEPAYLLSAAAALPLILLGNALGNRLHGRIPERAFRALVGLILLAAAVNLVLRALP